MSGADDIRQITSWFQAKNLQIIKYQTNGQHQVLSAPEISPHLQLTYASRILRSKGGKISDTYNLYSLARNSLDEILHIKVTVTYKPVYQEHVQVIIS